MSFAIKSLGKGAPVPKPTLPTDILKPKNRHLESLESERILYILDDIIRNCNLVAVFDSIISDLEEYKFLIGRQLFALFKTFKPVYEEYIILSKKIVAISDNADTACFELESNEEKDVYTFPDDFWTAPLEELVKSEKGSSEQTYLFNENEIEQLKESTLKIQKDFDNMTPVVQHFVDSILMAFRHNPLAADTVIKNREVWGIQRNSSLVNLLKYLNELRTIVFNKLLTTSEERDERARFLALVNFKEKQHFVTISNMKKNLEDMKLEKQRLIYQMNSEIQALQKEMYILDINSKNECQQIQHKTDRAICVLQNTHEETKTKLQNELVDLKQQYKDLVEKNKANELAIRRRKWKLETETENWINKYDNEMADYQIQYDDLKKQADEEKRLLEELQKRFEPLEKEYLQALEERRIQREKEEAERAEQEALVYWATVIQSFWRAWKARKAMRKNRRR